MTPTHSPGFRALARAYGRQRLARTLDGLYAQGLEAARARCAEQPLLFAANHVGWWDAFLLVALDEALRCEGRALMDAANLRRLRFFGWLGALPLSPASALGDLRAAADWLGRPGHALWVFPQGEQRPAHLRPLGFRGGVRLLAKLAPRAAVVPVAFQYAFREAPAPAAYAHLGAALPAAKVAAADGVARLERAVETGLAEIDAALAGHRAPFPALVPPRRRTVDGGLGARLLGGRPRPRSEDEEHA